MAQLPGDATLRERMANIRAESQARLAKVHRDKKLLIGLLFGEIEF